MVRPAGAFTSHFAGLSDEVAGVRAPWAGGSGPVTCCSGLITWFSGAWVSCTGWSLGGDWRGAGGGGVCALEVPISPAASRAAMTGVTL